MKILICLAMSFGLTAILYFYIKQRLSSIETRLNTLTELIHTLANECCKQTIHPINNFIPSIENVQKLNHESEQESNSSDSESDNESDSDSDSESDSESNVTQNLNESNLNKLINLEYINVNKILESPLSNEITIQFGSESSESIQEVNVDKKEIELSDPIIVYKTDKTDKTENSTLIEVSDDESVVKQINVNMEDYSNLSLKELKQKVADLGGPPLKTKQALLNFLKKKV